MLPDSDDYLSSDDTDMDESQSSSLSLCSKRPPELASLASLASAQKIVAEMDYSLLAVDMQKLLHISRAGTGTGVPAEEQSNNGHGPPVSVSLSRRPSIKMNEMEDIPDHRCSFCTGNFTAKESLSKHMLRVHHKDVVNILSQYSNSHDSLKCPYCVYRLSEKHKKLFLLHLEKKHSFELVASIKEHLSSSTDAAAKAGRKDKEPWNRLVNNSVRRKLELEPAPAVGATVAAQLLYLKENAPSHRNRNGTRTLDEESMTNLMWKRSAVKQFVCGRCQQAFSYNALLLDHINVRHRGPLKLVQPLYHCGLCTATFFKNKFLVRHCLHHHSPPTQ